MKKLSLVISVYNEEAVLEKFYNAFCNIEQDLKYGGDELIFVNDGSTDASMNILEVIAQQNKNVRVISFSRNFGHEAAMIAGIDHAAGDVIICMDADLQHPLECIAPIMAKFEEGYGGYQHGPNLQQIGRCHQKLYIQSILPGDQRLV